VIARVQRGPLQGRIEAPPSKSYTHRALVLGALADGVSVVRGPLVSADTEATMDALTALGIGLSRAPDRVDLRGGTLSAPAGDLDARNSGTTLRLVCSVAALLDTTVGLTGDESLRRRPIGPLIDALGQLGARCEYRAAAGCAPVRVRGPLSGAAAKLPGDVSSQFVSSLLLAAPCKATDTSIVLTTTLASAPYVEVTLEMMERFGVTVERSPGVYRVRGGEGYLPAAVTVPGDYSSAAFLLAGAAVSGGRVVVDNLEVLSRQADARITPLLSLMGAGVRREDGGIAASAGELRGREIGLRDSPDLFPALAVVAAAAKGKTRLTGAPHLRLKESDRIAAVARMLAAMGVGVRELPDGLEVEGGRLRGAVVDPGGDHRIAMAAAVAGLAAEGTTTVLGAECVRVSYPAFFEHLRRLGALVEVSA